MRYTGIAGNRQLRGEDHGHAVHRPGEAAFLRYRIPGGYGRLTPGQRSPKMLMQIGMHLGEEGAPLSFLSKHGRDGGACFKFKCETGAAGP